MYSFTIELVSNASSELTPDNTLSSFTNFFARYKLQFTNEIFKIVALATRKPPTDNIQDEQSEVIKGKFYEKELIRVI